MLQEWYESSLEIIKNVGNYIASASKDIAEPILNKVSNETA